MLGALARGPRRARAHRPDLGALAGSTPSASSAAAASPSARPARSTRSSRRARHGPERALEQVRTTCTFCGVGCQIDLNLDPQTKHIVKVTSKDEYLPNEGNLCVKGRFAFNFVHHPDRLTQPLVRGEDGELHPTTWEHALETAATGLKRRHRRARPAVGRLPLLGPPDERGELPHPEARAHGGRDELRPLVRVDLTRSDSLRPGQVVRQRSKHQLDPGDRERPLPASSSARTRPRRTRCSRCGSRRRCATARRSSSPTRARSG